MNPKVYLYSEKNDKFQLYLGEFPTVNGLNLFEKKAKISLVNFGATSYKGYGWATENEVPKFEIMADIIIFFENESDLGLIEFEIEIDNIGRMSSHDDGECTLVLSSRQLAYIIIRKVAPAIYQDLLLSELINNQNKYITINKEGEIRRFTTFEHYVKSEERSKI